MSDLRETQDYLAEVIADRDRLRAALEQFGDHDERCLYVRKLPPDNVCSCGFSAALAGAGERPRFVGDKPVCAACGRNYGDHDDGYCPSEPASAQHTDDEAHDRSADANWIAGATFGYIRGQMNEHQQYKDAVEARWKRIAESRAAFPLPAAPTKESAP